MQRKRGFEPWRKWGGVWWKLECERREKGARKFEKEAGAKLGGNAAVNGRGKDRLQGLQKNRKFPKVLLASVGPLWYYSICARQKGGAL